jgi:hypothetical protein
MILAIVNFYKRTPFTLKWYILPFLIDVFLLRPNLIDVIENEEIIENSILIKPSKDNQLESIYNRLMKSPFSRQLTLSIIH